MGLLGNDPNERIQSALHVHSGGEDGLEVEPVSDTLRRRPDPWVGDGQVRP